MAVTSPPSAASSRATANRHLLVAGGIALLAAAGSVAALLLGGGAPPDLPPGMADPGVVVGWGLRATRLSGLLAAVVTTGSLLVVAWYGPADDALRRRCLRAAGAAAAVWTLGSVLGYVLVVCDLAGTPLADVGAQRLATGWTATAAAAQLTEAALAGALALAASASAARPAPPTTAGGCVLLVLALAAALPVPVTGHAGTTADQQLAVSGLIVHVVAALVWTGGLTGLLVHLRHRGSELAVAAIRFSTLALFCYVTLAGSGLVAATAAMSFGGEDWRAAFAGGYAAVLAAKLASLLVIGMLGAAHRRRTLPELSAGSSRAFVRLAVAELALMGLASGLAAALARTPPPVETAGTHAGAMSSSAAPTMLGLATTWRPDPLVLVALGAAAVAYLTGVRRLRARGGTWPRERTASFATGLGLAGLALCSAAAAWSRLLLSVHLAQLATLLLVVPLLLLGGRPFTLVRTLRGRPLGAALERTLASPWAAAALTCVVVTVLLRTPLITLSLSSGWWHLAVVMVLLGCGTALLASLVGESGPEPGRGVASSRAWLATVGLALGAAGARLLLDDRVLAAGWFLELRLGWIEPMADQRHAGAVLLVAAAGCAGLALLAPGPRRGQR